jgi:hypothetical protein
MEPTNHPGLGLMLGWRDLMLPRHRVSISTLSELLPDVVYHNCFRADMSIPYIDTANALNMDNLRTLWPTSELRQGTEVFHHELLPDPDHQIQSNVLADDQTKEHRVVWSRTDNIKSTSTQAHELLEEKGRGRGTGDGQFVRNLKLGDVVTVWARARFPGWVNHVESVQIDVYWVV